MIEMTTANQKTIELDGVADEIAKIMKVKSIDGPQFEHVSYVVDGKQTEGHFYKWPAKTSRGLVSGNTLGEEAYLLGKIGEKVGLELTFPDVRATLEACYSSQTKSFRKNVLNPYYFRNGLLAIKTPEGVDIRRVMGAKFVDEEISKPSLQAVVDGSGVSVLKNLSLSNEKILQTKYVVGPTLQKEMPTKLGRFNEFNGAIPVDSELKSEGKAAWRGSYFDNDNLSAVWSGWPADGGVLAVGSYWPLTRGSYWVLPIFTNQNSKK